MIAIVDYGMGNVASVSTAFKNLGHDVIITDNKEKLKEATHLVLPGVGSFRAAVEEIETRDLKSFLQEQAEKKPFLGICLGMHLLFSEGTEGGLTKGLDLIPGTVEKIKTNHILPHIGWNALHIHRESKNWLDFQDRHVYFVHSFQAYTADSYLIATADYDAKIPAIVKKGHVYGIQFHPEKSGEVGQNILKTFLQEATL